MRNTRREGGEDLADFYETTYARLVSVIGAITGERQEAEEAVQEAFVRAVGVWHRVSTYDDPESWLRKVALGHLSNRRRKVRNGLRAVRRHGPPPDAAAPTGDAVDLGRALAALPRAQREVVVLQHLGLGMDAIAAELGVPVGTVKSRLSRARSSLVPLLIEREARDHV